jgi:hypothetical protein
MTRVLTAARLNDHIVRMDAASAAMTAGAIRVGVDNTGSLTGQAGN